MAQPEIASAPPIPAALGAAGAGRPLRPEEAVRRRRPLLIGLFAFVLLAEFALGFYYAYVIGYMHSDAMSRVANAFYVLYSRDPHLAAIGFVWNPLPSLVDMLFLLLYPIVPAMASAGLAGIIMSSLFAAGTTVLLAAAGIRYRLGTATSVALALLYSLNPFVFLFGSNGLSDAPFNFFIIWSVLSFIRWFHEEKPFGLVAASFTLALAFWTRYEAVPFGVALFGGTLIATLLIHRRAKAKPLEQRRWGYQSVRAEGTLILLLAPAVYSGLLWVWWNYLIMGNPLYFLNSEYSNVAQAAPLMGDTTFKSMVGNPWLSLIKVARKTAYYAIPLGVIVLLRLLSRRLLQWDFAILCLMFVSIPAMQYVMLMKGTTFAWFRYFMYVFPITVAWLPYELSQARGRITARALVFAGLLGSAALLTYAMTNPKIAPDENTFLTLGTYYDSQKLDRSIADYFDREMPDATIMMDSSSAFTIIVNSKKPQRYVITSDRIFRQALTEPIAHGVDYILIPKPMPESSLSTINTTYPNLYEKGAVWCEFYKDFGGGKWRMYKVTGFARPDLQRQTGKE
ncbi:glycosyltransferase family 39 protein [Paenibacillus flagellatus]|uniref:Glycosyltransferase RgtA/B/C/D-like domain-containing protein n=1 Tax=Paenibacillus flagellatus TaxID=2211139 RepID=A0A2V5JX93_9BACL|nr:glycosyltransferase family 39 protein [Paenibacillus flagellatus]PYI51408.1 hypothetical protein DLM86_25670 [Paenibacillus flagellatus]